MAALKAVCFIYPKDRNRTQGSKESQKPPREDDVALVNAIGKCRTDKCRSRCSSECIDTRGDPIQSPQHAETGCGVSQEDGAAGKAEDTAYQLAEHEHEHNKTPDRCRYECSEGCHEVEDRGGDGSGFGAVEDTKSLGRYWEDEELNEHANDTDQGVVYTNCLGVCAEIVKTEA